MSEAQDFPPRNSRDGYGQLRILPSIREILKEEHFLPPCTSSSNDRQSTLTIARSSRSRDGGIIASSMRHQPSVSVDHSAAAQQQHGPPHLDSRETVRVTNKHQPLPKVESALKTPSHAHGPHDSKFAGDIGCRPGQHRRPNVRGSTMTSSSLKRRRDIDGLDGCGARDKSEISGRSPSSKKRLQKQGKDEKAAVSHMMMERQRRLDIGDLIRQIASHIKVDGSRVEILESTVAWIKNTNCKIAKLDAELKDLRCHSQTLNDRWTEPPKKSESPLRTLR
ncbi:MAG: hypothetical protein Q9182_003747 [Xanthomendoza sp. 2 TL-2023]